MTSLSTKEEEASAKTSSNKFIGEELLNSMCSNLRFYNQEDKVTTYAVSVNIK
jgi:hypothetical protein